MTGPTSPTTWLSLPELVEATGETLGRVRKLLEERHLLGTRRDGPLKVPAVFLVDGEPLNSLRGTVIVLLDAGLSEDEALDWLLSPDEALEATPIDALLAGRKREVRRVAMALA